MAQKEKLEEAKRLYQTANADQRYVLESLFPELKESEDERIRKELIFYLRYQHSISENFEDIGKWIAWLEKQGSQNNTEDEDLLYRFCFYSYKDESNILYLSGLYVNGECRNKGIGTKILEVADEVAKNLNCYAIRLKTKIGSNAERLYRRNGYNTLIKEGNQIWLEKQGEQNPIINVPPREIILAIWDLGNEWKELTNGSISTEYGTQLDYIQKHWHESEYYLREKQGGQKPTDKDMVEALRTEYEKGRADAFAQMQKEWSEEDEKMVANLVDYFKVDDALQYTEKQVVDWLKSLKERYTWKPSDEQIVVLELASMYERVFTPKQIDILIDLKEQLKKLKGE